VLSFWSEKEELENGEDVKEEVSCVHRSLAIRRCVMQNYHNGFNI
jgi:hypothetical protein